MHLPGAEPDIALAATVTGPPLSEGRLPTAVVAHGAGSDAGFVIRAFGRPLVEAGWRLVAFDLRGHRGSTPVVQSRRLRPADHAADLQAVAERVSASLIGGVSMGAHAAVLAATGLTEAGRAPGGLLLAMPAWTGVPDAIARANLLQADEIERIGIEAALRRITRAYPGWVADELAGSWPHHDAAAFTAVLWALGDSAAPTLAQLAATSVPAGVVALAGDPMHPAAVAARWAAALPMASLRTVTQPEIAADRAVLGRAALAALGVAATDAGLPGLGDRRTRTQRFR